jgi:hypothetical protein
VSGLLGSEPSPTLQEQHLHVKATMSGRMLIGHGDVPMSEEHIERMKTVLEDPAAADMAQGLLHTANMGLQVIGSGSPAFAGLLVARVISASVTELKNPLVQLAVEDDKVWQKHSCTLSSSSCCVVLDVKQKANLLLQPRLL